MNEEEFIILGKEILDKLKQKEEPSKISLKLRKIQIYIFNNQDKKIVKEFISNLIKIYLELFFKKELIEALNLPDNLYYHRQILVYINLPYTTNYLYAEYLPRILTIPSDIYGDVYETFHYVLKKYTPTVAENPYIQAILNFVRQNNSIIHGSKDKYYSLSEEIDFFNKARRNLNFKELEDFLLYENYFCRPSINSFLNKKIGNIGEIYTHELIKNLYYNCFVSRDVKNGFGYDIYFYNDSVENLVEVKTTMNNYEEDYFSLSENEYGLMKRCFNNSNARYIICRVKLDDLFKPSYTLLTMKDFVTLSDQNDEIEYKLFPSIDRNFYFKTLSPRL